MRTEREQQPRPSIAPHERQTAADGAAVEARSTLWYRQQRGDCIIGEPHT